MDAKEWLKGLTIDRRAAEANRRIEAAAADARSLRAQVFAHEYAASRERGVAPGTSAVEAMIGSIDAWAESHAEKVRAEFEEWRKS